MGINIDGITRTKTTIVGDERMVGRDDLGDFKVTIDDLLESLAGKLPPGMMIEYVADGDPAVNGDRVILQQGQTVLIADYQNAFDKVYKDQTTPAFFKCDVGGTPNAAGLYFIMQDRRAVVPKGIGDQDINGRTKSGPSELSAVEEDRGQGWQAGASQDNTGSRDTWMRAWIRDKLDSTSLVGAGYTQFYLETGAQGDAKMIKAMNDGTNGDPRTGATTRENSIGTIWGLTY
jgi:hypothetical protein